MPDDSEFRETLKLLEAQIKASLLFLDQFGPLKTMTPCELEAYKKHYGDFDFIVGRFAIRDLLKHTSKAGLYLKGPNA